MLLRRAWALIRDTTVGFAEDEAMTRGAAIACYTMFSLAPLLFLAVAIAGLAFSEEAVQGALAEQLRALVGHEGAEACRPWSAAPAGTAAMAGAVAFPPSSAPWSCWSRRAASSPRSSPPSTWSGRPC